MAKLTAKIVQKPIKHIQAKDSIFSGNDVRLDTFDVP